MQEATSREKVLKKIRKALIHKSPQRFPNIDWDKNIYSVDAELSLEEQFAVAFNKVGGQFIFCENEIEFLDQLASLSTENKWSQFYCTEPMLRDILDRVEFPYTSEIKSYPEGIATITGCEALVARLGSVIISSKLGSGRRLFVAPTTHLIVAYTSQVVPELKDAFNLIRSKYGDQMPSMIASLTGPSRTADIEKTLVTPAHGPRDIFVFLIDNTTV